MRSPVEPTPSDTGARMIRRSSARCRVNRLAPLLLIPLLAAAPAVADNVFLKNGRVFEDVIAEVGLTTVRIHLAFGEMSVSLDAVERVERAESSLVVYQARRDALRADPSASAAQWVELARWALAQGDTHSAREAALRAAEKNPRAPGVAELMRGLDHVFDEQLGRWIPFAESMHIRGYQKVDGQWLSAEQQLARSQAAADAARQIAADEERRLTQAVLALAAVQLTKEPEPQPQVVYTWPVAVYPNPFIWGHPNPHQRPPQHHGPVAIPLERRQPGSLLPVAGNHGRLATPVARSRGSQ